jgi:hypothetical protein
MLFASSNPKEIMFWGWNETNHTYEIAALNTNANLLIYNG